MCIVMYSCGGLCFTDSVGGGEAVGSLVRVCQEVRCLHGGNLGVGRVTSCMSVTPDILSTLCSDILPACMASLGRKRSRRSSLSLTLTRIGGISGGHLLNGLTDVGRLLFDLRPTRNRTGAGPFVRVVATRVRHSIRRICGCDKDCLDCDLSSSYRYLGIRPCLVRTSRSGACIGIARVDTCGAARQKIKLFGGRRGKCVFFGRHRSPRVTLFDVCLRLPVCSFPPFLGNLCLDLSCGEGPVTHHVLFMGRKSDASVRRFLRLGKRLIPLSGLARLRGGCCSCAYRRKSYVHAYVIPSPRLGRGSLRERGGVLSL